MDFNSLFATYWRELIILFLIVAVGVPVFATIYIIVNWSAATTFSESQLKKQVNGKTMLVSGGSKGLGKSICMDLIRAGANVIILARGTDLDSSGKSSLEYAVEECREEINQRARKNQTDSTDRLVTKQWVKGIKVDTTNYDSVLGVIRSEAELLGRLPDWVFSFVGGAKPGFIVERITNSVPTHNESQTKLNFFSTTHLIDAILKVARELVPSDIMSTGSDCKDGVDAIAGFTFAQAQKLPERLIFAGSAFSFVASTGYSAYCASKYALRGYCDALRQEMLPLGVKVHLLCLGNIDTPGYKEECVSKPEIAAIIEGNVVLSKPDVISKSQLGGILSGRYIITIDFLLELLRIIGNGVAPKPLPVAEMLASPLINLIATIYGWALDGEVHKFYAKLLKSNKKKL